MQLSEDPECKYCENTDILTHIILHCPIVKQFWVSLFMWWNSVALEIIECEENIVFGGQKHGEHSKVSLTSVCV